MTQSQRLFFVLLFLLSFIEVHYRASLPPSHRGSTSAISWARSTAATQGLATPVPVSLKTRIKNAGLMRLESIIKREWEAIL